jgi:predicted DNA-binding transcriptional regulator YafY
VTTIASFEGRNLLSLKEYFQSMFQSNQGLLRAVVLFNKASLGGRPLYGSISQTDVVDKIRAEFMIDSIDHMARWLMMFGTSAEVEEPESLKVAIAELAEELLARYGKVGV